MLTGEDCETHDAGETEDGRSKGAVERGKKGGNKVLCPGHHTPVPSRCRHAALTMADVLQGRIEPDEREVSPKPRPYRM